MKSAEKDIPQKLRTYRIVAYIFTALYFLLCCGQLLVKVISIPEEVVIVGVLVWLGFPVLVLLSWYMYIELYMHQQLRSTPASNRDIHKRRLLRDIILKAVLGIVAFLCVISIVNYVEDHWKYVTKLTCCIVIKGMIAVGWLFCWWLSCRKRKIGEAEKKHVSMIVLGLVFLVAISIVGNLYVEKVTEVAWYENMVEYFEQKG